MAVAGALIGKAIGAFGSKPIIPDWNSINPTKVQGDAISGNIANFADASKLASGVNTFNQDQLNAMLEKAFPGARSAIQGNIASMLKGEIPSDVSAAIGRSSVARGFSGGFGGSGLGRNLTARDLGLSSLDIMQQGVSSAERWMQQTTVPQFDISSSFLSPATRLGFEQQQQTAKFQRDLLAAQVAAAPDPATAALGKEIDRFFNTAASIGTMAAGGGGGGMMGGGGG